MPPQGVQEAAAAQAVLGQAGLAGRRLHHPSLKHSHTAGMRASHPFLQQEQQKPRLVVKLVLLLLLQRLLRLTLAAVLQLQLVVLCLGPHPRAPRPRACSSSWLVGRQRRRHSH
jgi:hypothetical protein